MIVKKDCDKNVVTKLRLLGIISGLFYKKILHTKKAHKMQTSDFHSDTFIRLESIKKQTSSVRHK